MVKLNWDRILEVVKIGVLIVIAYSLFEIASEIWSGLSGIEYALLH